MSRALAALGAGSAGHAPPAVYRRAGAALAAEWIKLRSLRSMLVTPLLGVVASIGVADLAVHNNATGWPHLDAVQKAQFDPLGLNFNFVTFGIDPALGAVHAGGALAQLGLELFLLAALTLGQVRPRPRRPTRLSWSGLNRSGQLRS